jgi:hypothetical protein
MNKPTTKPKPDNNIPDMHNQTYRFDYKQICLAGCLVVFSFFLLLSCQKKEVASHSPQIIFVTDSGYAAHDTTLMAGQKIRVAIKAKGTGANITFFSIRYNDGSPKIILDTGMNRPELSYALDIIKTSGPIETWTFFIMDRNRLQDSVKIILTKSEYSQWGKIRTLENITLGAQERADTGSFFTFSTGEVFTLGQAFMNQSAIDLVYYYGQYEGTFASPAEAEAPGFFTGTEGIASWTVKNETRYDTTTVTTFDFDSAGNDSLLLAAYDPSAGKRKAKYLQPGMVVAFKSPAAKLGLIKVTGLSGTTAGSLKFTVKIQE